MLKNEGVLPLAKNSKFVYVVGPNALNNRVLLGNYYGISDNLVSIVEGITAKMEPGCAVKYRQGVLLDRQNVNPIDWTTGLARDADVTVAVMGISPLLESEEGAAIASPHRGDRKQIKLPQNQIDYLKKLKENNPKPLVLVLTGGSAIDISEVEDLADAILFAWYPGEQGGNAVADVLFGDVSPAGRLPVTFYSSIDQLPPYDDYSMVDGHTYRYMDEEPLYPFGYGLSYTSFEYSDLQINKSEIKKGGSVKVKVKVTNTGAT